MADTQRDIDGIVREVVRRLLDSPTAASRAGTEQPAPADAPRASATPTSHPDAGPGGDGRTLSLSERVVTLAAVQSRLDGIQCVVVPTGALVTPAVYDEFRKRKIQLVRGGETLTMTTRTDTVLLVGVAQVTHDPAILTKTVCAEVGRITCVTDDCVLKVVRRLADRIVAERRCAVLLTSQPAVALCVANRRRGVRAAWGWSVAAAAAATRAIGANLLVVDPAAQSVFQMRRMVREFVHTTGCDCPAEYRAALEDT